MAAPTSADNHKAGDSALVAGIQAELSRVGCYDGKDITWDSPDMRLSVAKYARYAKLGVTPQVPDDGLLQTLKNQRDRLCPPECAIGEVVVGGQCVAKGSVWTGRSASPRPASRVAAARAVAKPHSATPSGHCFSFNGSQFCE